MHHPDRHHQTQGPPSASLTRQREELKGSLYDGLEASVCVKFLEHEIDVWDKMIVALDQGQLRPYHMRARNPG